jgi:hypothetical protein
MMTMITNIKKTAEAITKLAQSDRIAFKKHSILRMHERGIEADEVKNVLINGEIIESYPEIRPLPCFLLLGYTGEKKAIHTVVALDTKEHMLWIITVYNPFPKEWDPVYKRRIRQ